MREMEIALEPPPSEPPPRLPPAPTRSIRLYLHIVGSAFYSPCPFCSVELHGRCGSEATQRGCGSPDLLLSCWTTLNRCKPVSSLWVPIQGLTRALSLSLPGSSLANLQSLHHHELFTGRISNPFLLFFKAFGLFWGDFWFPISGGIRYYVFFLPNQDLTFIHWPAILN